MSSNLLECPVCLDSFNDPQMLTACGHSFCRNCITGLQSCPICRTRVDTFRPNFALRLVMNDAPSAPPSQTETASTGQSGIVRPASSTEKGQDGTIADMMALGLPWGLARLVSQEDEQLALRIFLLDNSGSTSTHDGRRLEGQRMVKCTRWEETRHMALQQARWNARIGTPCEFVLLNAPPGPRKRAQGLQSGLDFLRVDPQVGCVQAQCAQLECMLNRVQPCGQTPLVRRLREIHGRISQEHEALVCAGQRVVVVAVTDGLPTEPQPRFVDILRRITLELPVHIVIRLTTSEDSVVDFYNRLDAELEFPLEVLDDLESEAREVAAKGNGWITYTPLLHMLREQGTFVKLFDLLDERRLAPTEVMVLACLMLQEQGSQEPPVRRPEDFYRYACERLCSLPLVYDPIARREGPCIKEQALLRSLVPLSQRLALCCARRRRGTSSPWGLLKLGVREALESVVAPLLDLYPKEW